jgi:HK97 family phage major capsid protein
MEGLLKSLNNANVEPLTMGADGWRLDNYPVRWVEVLPVYDTADHASQLQGVFGDVSYQYLGLIPGVMMEVSKDVYFSTEERAVRALERFSTALMDEGAVAVLQLGTA